MYLLSMQAVVTETTIVGNGANFGGGIYVGGGTVLFDRCVIWGNCAGPSGKQALIEGSASVTFRRCVVDSSGFIGTPPIFDDFTTFSDPLFCDPRFCTSAPVGDYRVRSSSPCVSHLHVSLIGALPVGCSALSLVEDSWGAIKARYRALVPIPAPPK